MAAVLAGLTVIFTFFFAVLALAATLTWSGFKISVVIVGLLCVVVILWKHVAEPDRRRARLGASP
jgi:hypothetical protein